MLEAAAQGRGQIVENGVWAQLLNKVADWRPARGISAKNYQLYACDSLSRGPDF
jgi:hypothetical protein